MSDENSLPAFEDLPLRKEDSKVTKAWNARRQRWRHEALRLVGHVALLNVGSMAAPPRSAVRVEGPPQPVSPLTPHLNHMLFKEIRCATRSVMPKARGVGVWVRE